MNRFYGKWMAGVLAASLLLPGTGAAVFAEETVAACAAGDAAQEENTLVDSGAGLSEEEQEVQTEASTNRKDEAVKDDADVDLIEDKNPNSADPSVPDGIEMALKQLEELRSNFVPAPIASYELASDSENITMVYYFLTQYMGLNDAAACGVLTNIRLETGASFAPDHREGSGRSALNGTCFGTYDDYTGYGLCQWTTAYRKKSLYEWTTARIGSGAYGTLFGQLEFMWYEMSRGYGVNGYKTFYDFLLNGVPNTEQGAYLAAYWMCAGYEMPYYYNRPYGTYKSESDYRGEFSRQLYWPVFKGLTAEEGDAQTEADETKAKDARSKATVKNAETEETRTEAVETASEEARAKVDASVAETGEAEKAALQKNSKATGAAQQEATQGKKASGEVVLKKSAKDWQADLKSDPFLEKISERLKRFIKEKEEDQTEEETEGVETEVAETETEA
ncbi:MAG: phage tail tip lysozyme [Lachnospiraceae bacterium]|nr:phage tail tip lysozyme [Lachnospiraceae bacterium]